MRLYDLFRQSKFRAEQPFMNFLELKRPEVMTETEVILADNVADYFWDQRVGDKVIDRLNVSIKNGEYDTGAAMDMILESVDIPILAPPYPKMFIEYHCRSSYLSSLVPDIRVNGFVRLGCFVYSEELDEETRSRMAKRFSRDVRWRIIATMYMEPIPFRIIGPILQVRCTVRSDGSPEDISFILPEAVHKRALEDYEGDDGPTVAKFSGKIAISPLLLTICFMNCKNVVQQRIHSDRQMPKQFKRRKSLPYTEYKILDIRPLREALRRDGRVQEVGLKKALHICRGHFKTYSSDSPLFGRIEGTFWWGNFARGSGPGHVVKDYRVHPPEKQKDALLEGKLQ